MRVISVIKYLGGRGVQINENEFEEGLKDVQYVKGEAPVFEIPAYTIKAGKRWVKTGEYIHVVDNEMFNWVYTISLFINGIFNISLLLLRSIVGFVVTISISPILDFFLSRCFKSLM